jgi:hypothetical protein
MRRHVPFVLFLVLSVLVAGAWTWPVDGPVVQGYSFDSGHPYDGGQHRGIDIGSSAGASVRAPASGTVSFAGTVSTNGLTVTIQAADGLAVSLTHFGSLAVSRGDAVSEGDTIGTVGPSGTAEVDGPYVHLGIRVASDPNGYLDPLSLLPGTQPTSEPAQQPAQAPAQDPAPADRPADPAPAPGQPPAPDSASPNASAPPAESTTPAARPAVGPSAQTTTTPSSAPVVPAGETPASQPAAAPAVQPPEAQAESPPDAQPVADSEIGPAPTALPTPGVVIQHPVLVQRPLHPHLRLRVTPRAAAAEHAAPTSRSIEPAAPLRYDLSPSARVTSDLTAAAPKHVSTPAHPPRHGRNGHTAIADRPSESRATEASAPPSSSQPSGGIPWLLLGLSAAVLALGALAAAIAFRRWGPSPSDADGDVVRLVPRRRDEEGRERVAA